MLHEIMELRLNLLLPQPLGHPSLSMDLYALTTRRILLDPYPRWLLLSIPLDTKKEGWLDLYCLSLIRRLLTGPRGTDTPIIWQTLFERSELVCSPTVRVHPTQ